MALNPVAPWLKRRLIHLGYSEADAQSIASGVIPASGDGLTHEDLAAAIDEVVAGAPGALNTLKELADQMTADEGAAATLMTLVTGIRNLTDLTHSTKLNAAYVRQPALVNTSMGLKAPILIAHRGGLVRFPEASAEGYRVAARDGFLLEMDLRPLSDGTLVLCHDSTVTRTMTGITGNVNANTLAQWRAAKIKPALAGGRQGTPLTWQEMLDEFGGRAIMVIEFKETVTGPMVTAVLDQLDARGLQKSVIIQSSATSGLTTAAGRGFPCMLVPSDTSNDPATVKGLGIDYIAPGAAAVTQTYIAACAAAGLIVTPYTYNSRNDLATYMGYGAHGILSDDPWGASERYTAKTVESFDDGVMWPSADSYNAGSAFQFIDVGGGFTLGDGVNPSAVYRRLGQFHRGPMVGRYQFDIKFRPYASNQLRFVHIFIGHKPSDLCYADGIKSDDTAAGTQGYAFLIRRNGSKEIFNVDGTTKAQVATHASTTDSFGPAGAEGPTLTFEIVIDATNVTLKCLNDGTQVTWANTTHRYSDAFINVGNNGTQVTFKQIRVQR